MKREGKRSRIFSKAFKREKVRLIDEGKLTVRQLSEIYEVSTRAVYKWIREYSSIARDERIVVEKISEAKKAKELYYRIRELEQALGRKQLELDYYKEVVKIASEESGEDVEKKHRPKQ